MDKRISSERVRLSFSATWSIAAISSFGRAMGMGFEEADMADFTTENRK